MCGRQEPAILVGGSDNSSAAAGKGWTSGPRGTKAAVRRARILAAGPMFAILLLAAGSTGGALEGVPIELAHLFPEKVAIPIVEGAPVC